MSNNNLEEKLREASCLGDIETVRELLSQNVNINSQNPVNGWTALHWACKRGNEEISRVLLEHGADESVKNFKGETAKDLMQSGTSLENFSQDEQKFVPQYMKNPQNVEFGRIRTKHTDFSGMQTTFLPSTSNDDLVLKVRIHGSSDPDFIEIEIPRWKLTYNNLLKICCDELEIFENQIERIRKLPDTRLRKDNDVKRLNNYQSLEVVLKPPIIIGGDNNNKSSNFYQSISTCKNQTILY